MTTPKTIAVDFGGINWLPHCSSNDFISHFMPLSSTELRELRVQWQPPLRRLLGWFWEDFSMDFHTFAWLWEHTFNFLETHFWQQKQDCPFGCQSALGWTNQETLFILLVLGAMSELCQTILLTTCLWEYHPNKRWHKGCWSSMLCNPRTVCSLWQAGQNGTLCLLPEVQPLFLCLFFACFVSKGIQNQKRHPHSLTIKWKHGALTRHSVALSRMSVSWRSYYYILLTSIPHYPAWHEVTYSSKLSASISSIPPFVFPSWLCLSQVRKCTSSRSDESIHVEPGGNSESQNIAKHRKAINTTRLRAKGRLDTKKRGFHRNGFFSVV